MKTEHSYSAKGVLAALGRSALYLLFFVAVQVLLPFVYGIGIAADAAINRGADLAQGAQAVAERLLDGLSALTLLSCLIIAAVLLLWFLLRKKPLSEAAGLRHCSGWTVGFCAFGAVGLYVLVSLVLALLPESWMEEYGKAMRLSTETGLIPALAWWPARRLRRSSYSAASSSRGWNGPCRCGSQLYCKRYSLDSSTERRCRSLRVSHGPAFRLYCYRTGSILPTIAAHAAFNAMNDPLGAFGAVLRRSGSSLPSGRRMRGGLRALPPRFERTKNSAGGRSKAHIADGLRGDHRITEKAPFKESSLKGALRFCD